MGKKLTELGFDAGRLDLSTPMPFELSLVWHKRGPWVGPRDFVLSEHKELYWAFDSAIEEPINEVYVTMALHTDEKKRRVGIIQPINFRKFEVDGKLYLIVVCGRGRTRVAREANRRLIAAGTAPNRLIRVPSVQLDTDDTGAALRRDVENSHRRTITPLMIANQCKRDIDAGVPDHLVCLAAGVTSMGQVKNYLRLLEAPEEVQKMVDKGQIPMTAKVEDVEKVKEAVKTRGKLTAKDVAEIQGETVTKPMGKKDLQRWIGRLPNTAQGALVRAVLDAVQGLGTMEAYPALAPGEK